AMHERLLVWSLAAYGRPDWYADRGRIFTAQTASDIAVGRRDAPAAAAGGGDGGAGRAGAAGRVRALRRGARGPVRPAGADALVRARAGPVRRSAAAQRAASASPAVGAGRWGG